jgi:hypothetical protein
MGVLVTKQAFPGNGLVVDPAQNADVLVQSSDGGKIIDTCSLQEDRPLEILWSFNL